MTLASTINFSDTVPAPGSGKANVAWQNDGGSPTANLSAEVLAPASVGFSISSGVVASPAVPIILAPLTGYVTHCYFTTNTSDATNPLTFNVKFNGTDIISGVSATVAAGTSPGTVSTFALTSASVAITAGQKWEIDITSGTSSWSGIAQCF